MKINHSFQINSLKLKNDSPPPPPPPNFLENYCNRLGGHIPNLPSLFPNNTSQSQNAGKRETTYIYKNI